MTTPDQDLYFQYSDGQDLLAVTLVEREHLLRELGALTTAAQGISSGWWRITRFDVAHAQSLLYRLSAVTDAIDSLIEIINDYAGGMSRDKTEIENALQ